jgi:formylglycine-generating enzyme required for sulfatase activity
MAASVVLLLAYVPLWSQTTAWHAGIAKVTTRTGLNKLPGTAFVVALRAGSAYLVTGAHVVEGDSNPRIEFVADPDRSYQATIRHLEAGEERGLALLVVPSPPEGVLTLLEAGPPAPAIGTRVDVAGFPASLGGSFTVLDTTIAARQGRDLVLSRETGEGFSGGPVVREGGVVGLVFGREGFGRAVGSASLREYLEGHNLSWTRGEEITAKVTKPAESKPEPKPALLAGQVRTNPADGLSYVWIPPGEFQMGCSPGDDQCFDDEKPQHTVRITRGFWLGQTEVTVGAYKQFAERTGISMPGERVMGQRRLNPQWSDLEQPMVAVTWTEAKSYCESWAKGRLPTEAEWEYAARAGSTASRYGKLDEIAWYADNSGNERLDSARIWNEDAGRDLDKYLSLLEKNGNRIPRVKQKQPNSWGLHDMLGNVWEWVADWYDENYYQTLSSPAIDPKGPSSGTRRVARGGSWNDFPRNVRASDRFRVVPVYGGFDVGFRCVREVIP